MGRILAGRAALFTSRRRVSRKLTPRKLRPQTQKTQTLGGLENSDPKNSDPKNSDPRVCRKLRPSGVSKTQTQKNSDPRVSRKLRPQKTSRKTHQEKWMYPSPTDPKTKLPSAKFTTKYNCVKRDCITSRFPYFHSSFINIPSDVLSRLRQSHLNLLEVELDYQEVCSSK